MTFEPYAPQRAKHQPATRKLLDQLERRFNGVEIKHLVTSKAWCVRIVIGSASDSLPLATIARTVHEAANRMIMVTQFYDVNSGSRQQRVEGRVR